MAPTEGEFGQIAGANDERAMAIGKTKQQRRARARLHILVSRVVNRFAARSRMIDVGEHLLASRGDVDFLRGDAERAHQPPGVGLGAFARGEGRQSEAEHIFARQTERIHRRHRDEQRLSGVESARDADHHLFDFRGAQPLFEAVRLYVERLETQLGEPRFVGRHEGKATDFAQKSEIAVARRGEFESYATIVRRTLLHVGAGAERPLPHPLGKKTTDVDIGERQLRFVGKARRLGENFALLADQRFSVPREVRRRFALPRRRIEIGRKAARRMRAQSVSR